jgi:hypothetical protein
MDITTLQEKILHLREAIGSLVIDSAIALIDSDSYSDSEKLTFNKGLSTLHENSQGRANWIHGVSQGFFIFLSTGKPYEEFFDSYGQDLIECLLEDMKYKNEN